MLTPEDRQYVTSFDLALDNLGYAVQKEAYKITDPREMRRVLRGIRNIPNPHERPVTVEFAHIGAFDRLGNVLERNGFFYIAKCEDEDSLAKLREEGEEEIAGAEFLKFAPIDMWLRRNHDLIPVGDENYMAGAAYNCVLIRNEAADPPQGRKVIKAGKTILYRVDKSERESEARVFKGDEEEHLFTMLCEPGSNVLVRPKGWAYRNLSLGLRIMREDPGALELLAIDLSK